MKYASDASGRVVDGLVVVEDENQFAVERLELPDDDRDERIVDIDVAGMGATSAASPKSGRTRRIASTIPVHSATVAVGGSAVNQANGRSSS